MYLSCNTKKFHDNEAHTIQHILHNFWTSTHRGKKPFTPWRRHLRVCSRVSGMMMQYLVDQLGLLRHYAFRRAAGGLYLGGGSWTSDTSSGAYSPYSSIYSAASTTSVYSSLSDVSAPGLGADVEAAATADSDVEDGSLEPAASLHPVSPSFYHHKQHCGPPMHYVLDRSVRLCVRVRARQRHGEQKCADTVGTVPVP